MAVWLITGATGFVGRQVAIALHGEANRSPLRDDTVMVLGRRCPPGWPESRFAPVDLNDAGQIRAAIASGSRPTL